MRKVIFFLLFSLTLHTLHLTDEKGELIQPAKELLTLFDVPIYSSPHSQFSIAEILYYLQNHWMQEGKERWEMENRFEEKRELALPVLKAIGCIETIHAEKTHYRYALVLGSLGKTMQHRLDFLYEEWQKGVRFDQIVLLTGERDLDPKIEEFPPNLRTETELFLYLFQSHPLKMTVPHVVVNSPKQTLPNGTLRRPDTLATVRDWLSLLPTPGSCLAISTQPFVGYQEAVIRFALPPSFELECIGPGTQNVYPNAGMDLPAGMNPDTQTKNPPYPIAIYLDNFTKWLLYEHLEKIK